MVNSRLQQLDETFFALSDPTRRAIISRLADGDTTVAELSEPFQISAPAISKHLRVLERAGLPRKRFHDLRHTCASLLLAQGVHARVVMEILGHSQISLTMDTYSHVIPELQKAAAAQMDALLEA